MRRVGLAGAAALAFSPAVFGALVFSQVAAAQTPMARIEGLEEVGLAQRAERVVGEVQQAPRSVGEARRRGERARERVETLLRSEGYYAARYTVELRPREDAPPDPVVLVTPGPQFRIGAVAVSFDRPPGLDDVAPEVERAVALEPGAPARAADVLAAERRGRTALDRLGHPDAAALSRDVVVDHARNAMDVTYSYSIGPRARFGEVVATGTATVRTSLLRAASPFDEGDAYDGRAMEQLASNLRGTGAFEAVSVTLGETARTTPSGVAVRPVEVAVVQGPPRTLSLGASFASSDGVGVQGEWTRRNRLGLADSVTVKARVSELDRLADVELVVPHLRRANRTLSLGAGVVEETTDAFDRQAVGARVTLSQPLNARWRTSVGAALDVERETDLSTDVEDDLVRVSGSAGFTYTNVDDSLDPRTGARAFISFTPAAVTGGRSTTYVGANLGGSAYVTPRDGRVTLAGRARVATISGAGVDDIPVSARLYAGGGGSVRGFAFQALSPRDDDDEIIGGRSLVEGAVEARVRTGERLGFVAFVDGGAAGSNTSLPFSDVRYAAGVGVRYQAPFGPLRADIAFPLERESGDESFQIYLGVGQAF